MGERKKMNKEINENCKVAGKWMVHTPNHHRKQYLWDIRCKTFTCCYNVCFNICSLFLTWCLLYSAAGWFTFVHHPPFLCIPPKNQWDCERLTKMNGIMHAACVCMCDVDFRWLKTDSVQNPYNWDFSMGSPRNEGSAHSRSAECEVFHLFYSDVPCHIISFRMPLKINIFISVGITTFSFSNLYCIWAMHVKWVHFRIYCIPSIHILCIRWHWQYRKTVDNRPFRMLKYSGC